MGKKRLRVALKVLGAVKEHFQDTKNFIKDLTDEQNICGRGNFFTSLEEKS